MKRLTTKAAVVAAVAAATALGVRAEGYQVNTLSARQLGMAHTGVALHLGTESQYFNPAGLAFMDSQLEVQGAFTALMPTATCMLPGGQKWETDNKVSTPVMASAAFSIYPSLKAGIAFYVPYGSSINWTDNWSGSVLNQSADLKVYTIQPTMAWQPLKGLSVGAGLTISWGEVDMNKGLVSASTTDAVLAAMGMGDYAFGTTTPASVNLEGTAQVRCGVNLGAMWDITDRWTVGMSWRSQARMRVKAGEATVIYANQVAETVLSTLNVLNQANFAAQMPCPWVWSLGGAYKPLNNLTIALDARLTGWHAYKQLDIEFLAEQLQAYNQNIAKSYHNSWAVSLGAEYGITERFDVRCGVMVDTTPVNDAHYNPETPGMTKIEPSVGFSFRPIDKVSIDFGFMYVAGCGKSDASCEYTDLLAAQMPYLGISPVQEFTGDYNLHAVIPSIGVTLRF